MAGRKTHDTTLPTRGLASEEWMGTAFPTALGQERGEIVVEGEDVPVKRIHDSIRSLVSRT
jgi:hypothetical protein